MSSCLLAAALLLGPTATCPDAATGSTTLDGPRRPAPDAWFAEDKARHFAMSFAATLFAYGAARFALDEQDALRTAGGTAFALGVGKEIHDHRTGAGFSVKDLVWDAAGVALGLTLAKRIH